MLFEDEELNRLRPVVTRLVDVVETEWVFGPAVGARYIHEIVEEEVVIGNVFSNGVLVFSYCVPMECKSEPGDKDLEGPTCDGVNI